MRIVTNYYLLTHRGAAINYNNSDHLKIMLLIKSASNLLEQIQQLTIPFKRHSKRSPTEETLVHVERALTELIIQVILTTYAAAMIKPGLVLYYIFA